MPEKWKNEMSLCDIEIFKTAVVQKWGPIKLGQWLICHKEPLVNYNQRSNDLFEWYLDFPSFFLFGRDLRKSPLYSTCSLTPWLKGATTKLIGKKLYCTKLLYLINSSDKVLKHHTHFYLPSFAKANMKITKVDGILTKLKFSCPHSVFL